MKKIAIAFVAGISFFGNCNAKTIFERMAEKLDKLNSELNSSGANKNVENLETKKTSPTSDAVVAPANPISKDNIQPKVEQELKSTENKNQSPDFNIINSGSTSSVSVEACKGKIQFSSRLTLTNSEMAASVRCSNIGFEEFGKLIDLDKIVRTGTDYSKSAKLAWTLKESIDQITDKRTATVTTLVKTDKDFNLKFNISCSKDDGRIRFYFDTNQIHVGTRILDGGGQASDGRAVVDKTPQDIPFILEPQSVGKFEANLTNFGNLIMLGGDRKVVALVNGKSFNNGGDTELIYSFPYRIGFEFNTLRGKAFVNVPLYDPSVYKALSTCEYKTDLEWARPVRYTSSKNFLK